MMAKIMRSVLLFGLGVVTCLALLWLPETFDESRAVPVGKVETKPVNVGVQQTSMLDASHEGTNTSSKQSDIVHVHRLEAISFEQPLVAITVPQQVTRSVMSTSAHSSPVVAVPIAASTDTPNQAALGTPLTDETVSADLLAKFNRAMAETSDAENIPVAETTETYNAVPIAELPERLRAQVPNISYNSHVYSSKPQNRSVRLNNRDLREGSWLSENVEVLEIMQNEVIMRVGPQSFSLKALADWSK